MKDILTVIIVLLAAAFVYTDFGPKAVSGRVVDSGGNGVPGLTVRARQQSWDWRPTFTRNKDFIYTTRTDSQGRFKLLYYRGGPEVHLQFYKVDKDPYMKTFDVHFWEHPIVRYP